MENIYELGQLFMTGISGLVLTEDEKSFISDNNIGGVILFRENYESPGQLAELVNSIQMLRDEHPLFIAVDQEGGRVRRFQTHFTQFPAMKEFGRKDSPKLTFDAHKIMGEELKACGVNINMSPVCDILTNNNNKVIGDRAFGDNKELVEKHVSAAIRGLHTGGVLACSKHFPGHGGTTKDSHFDLPYVTTPLEELLENELQPFVKAAKSRAEFMMLAHLVVDAIDPELPCTLSPKAYEFLREKCKYKKIIISDDMEMKAISEKYGYGAAATKALIAGVDILEYRSMEACEEAFVAVKLDIKERVINKSIFKEKLARVQDCKKRFLKDYSPINITGLSKLFKEGRNKNLLEEISRESL